MSVARRLALVLGAPLAGLLVLAALPGRVDLIVDNATAEELLVWVRGEPRGRVEGGGTLRLDGVGAGRVRLEAAAAAPAPARGVFAWEGELTAPWPGGPPCYVWNVGCVTSAYFVVAEGYGSLAGRAPRPEPLAPRGEVFALDDGLLPGLDLRLPSTALIPRDQDGALRRALWTYRRLARIDLVVDNGSDADVSLTVGGRDLGVVAQGAHALCSALPAGRLLLRAAPVLGGAGRAPHELAADALPELWTLTRPVYVWRLGPLRPYVVVARRYGDVPDVPPLQPCSPPGPFFRAPPDCLPGLDVELPRSRQGPGVLRALWTERRLVQQATSQGE